MPSQGVTNAANAIVNKINNLISSHNSNSNAHQDIRNSIPKIFYAACDCSEQNELIELECEDWNTEQGNIIYVRFNNVDNHDRTDVMVLNINEESIPLHHNTTDFYNITPLTLFRDTVVKFTCYFIDENRPIFLYEFSTLTSELYNDIGFITSSSVPSASSATPLSDTQNGGVGTGKTWARSDHTHPKSSLYAEASHTHEEYIQNQECYFDGDDFVIISNGQTITKTLKIVWNDNDNANGSRPRYLQSSIGDITTYLSEESEWSVSVPVDNENDDWSIPSVLGYIGMIDFSNSDDTTTIFTYEIQSYHVSPSDSPGSDEKLDPDPIKIDVDE